VATPKPVALATTAISIPILVPSANEVTIRGFWPCSAAKRACVSGVRYGSWSPFTFPASTGRHPMERTQRSRFISTPGWSPSALVITTPARSAYTFRIGPTVASTSAFISTTWRPCSMARSATRAPSSTSPVASITTSIPPASQRSMASSVTACRAAGDRLLQRGDGAHPPRRRGAGVGVGALRFGEGAVGDGHQPHPRHAGEDLEGGAAAHVAGAHQRHADGVPGGFAALQRGVDDDHRTMGTGTGEGR
jgi:hypothetical protein